MQELYGSQDPHGFLDGEGEPEPGAGPGGVAEARSERLERHHRVGVRTGEKPAGRNRFQCRKRDQGERRALQSKERRETHRKRAVEKGASRQKNAMMTASGCR